MFSAGTEEYILTLGTLISFAGFLLFALRGRKSVSRALVEAGMNKRALIAAIFIVVLFVSLELLLVKPTQQLFFDDVIYQGGALDLLHTGQAWQCNYGSPVQCFTGLIFHEPVGTAFNIAIAFAIFGVHQYAAYGLFLFLSALSVLLVFAITMMLFKESLYGVYAGVLMALSPVLLVWAFPTTSDLPMLAYSLIAMFSAMVFVYKKDINTFGMLAFSIVLVSYMKVDAVVYILLIPLLYLILDDKSFMESLRNNLRRIKENALNTKVLIILLFFVLSVSAELTYTSMEYSTGVYRYNNTVIQDTCVVANNSFVYINVLHNIDLQNFGANVCVNTFFWFDAFQGSGGAYHIMQPLLFTALAIIGALIMLARYRRQALALILWFFAFFILYTSFYAGAATYGVDWRFALSMIAQASILGGFGAGAIALAARKLWRMKGYAAAIVVISLLIAYSFYTVAADLSISPAAIGQAQHARFYQNFVYDNANSLPRSCLVFSFDPELFNLNGLSAMQFGNITSAYTQAGLESYLNKYPCLVVDYGYWCYTSGYEGLCNEVKSTFALSQIAVATDNYSGTQDTYGLYKITGLR